MVQQQPGRTSRTQSGQQLYADDVRCQLLLDVAASSASGAENYGGPQAGVLALSTDMLEHLVITEQPGEIPMRLEAIVPNIMTQVGELQNLLPLNGHLRLACQLGDDPVFTIQDFWIREREYLRDPRERVRIVAYDPLWQLNKDECVYFMAQPTNPASSIIRRVLTDRQIPMDDNMTGPTTNIWGLRFASPTRLQLIMQVLMWAFEHADPNGPDKDPWFPSWRDGHFTLLQPGNNQTVWWVRQTDSLAYFSHLTSIEDFVSEVLVLGPDFMQAESGNPWDFASPFGALIPNENVNYYQLAGIDPSNPPASTQANSPVTSKLQVHSDGACWLDTFDGNGVVVGSQLMPGTACNNANTIKYQLHADQMCWLDIFNPAGQLIGSVHVESSLCNQTGSALSTTTKYQFHDDTHCWLDTFDASGNLISSQQVADSLCSTGAVVPDDIALVAHEAVDLFSLASFQQAQQYAHIRKVIQADAAGSPAVYIQQALDILNIQGIPWDVRDTQTVLMPWVRRGDALLVTGGTMDTAIGIITGAEHDFTPPGKSHFTMDSSGILGRRVRRQHYIGPLPSGDGNDILPSDLPGAPSNQDPTQPAAALIPDPSQWNPANPQPWDLGGRGAAGAADTTRAGTVGLNADPVSQTMQWTCSAASTAWLLHTEGFSNVGELDVKDQLGSSAINPQVGLAHADGRDLVDLLRKPPYNLNAKNFGPTALSYDDLLNLAGTKPVVFGGIAWNHWTGLKGKSGDNLILANPAPGWKGVQQVLTRAQAAALGPFYAVYVDP